MKLSRLELFGFKSFLNRTVFHFHSGVTSIVGPNGCGKSNILDAIIWVLGERGTKSLRVKDMGDVIFHGSNGKRPVNVAEVSLELSDGPRNHTVKRRIYRDGTTDYFLNGDPARLKDIQDFFLGTGIGLNAYAIVEQGKIESFIQMKPQERRILIEEASGITRFEEKKRDALARLEEVRANLERVEDIYSEVSKSFQRAEKEWDRWKAYKLLADRLHGIEREMHLDGFSRLTRRLSKLNERLQEIDRDRLGLEERRLRLREEMETKERQFALADGALRQMEVEIKEKEKDMESRLLELSYVRAEEKRVGETGESLKARLAGTGEQLRAGAGEIEALKGKAGRILAEIGDQESSSRAAQESMETVKATLDDYEKRMEVERVGLFVIMSSLTEVKNRIGEIERITQERAKREERRLLEEEALRDKVTELEGRLGDLGQTLAREREERDVLLEREARALADKEALLAAAREARHAIELLKGEKRGKEEFLRKLSPGKQEEKNPPRTLKRLLDLVRVEEEKVKALERFFYREMEYHVIPDSEQHRIREIVEAQEGNYLFFPPRGIFHTAGQEVEVRVLWVDHLTEALQRIAGGEEGIFMNDGFLVDSRGLILRQQESRTIDLKAFRERKKTEKEIRELETAIGARLTSLGETERAHQRGEQEWKSLRAVIKGREEVIHRREQEVVALNAQRTATIERLTALAAPTDFGYETPLSTIGELEEQQARHERERIDGERRMAGLKGEMEVVKKKYDLLQREWHDVMIRLERTKSALQALQGDEKRWVETLRNLEEEKAGTHAALGRTEKEKEDLLRKARLIEESYDELKRSFEKRVERYETVKMESGNLHMERSALKEKAEALAAETEKLQGKRENVEKEQVVLQEKRDTIRERLVTVYHVENPDESATAAGRPLDDDREAVAKEIEEMGEINFRAEKEYEELKERMAFLETQKGDLKDASESLKKTIAKIDNLSREIFFETFDMVNATFKRFTATLFRGEGGSLAFNPDSNGIDMYVQPQGKKVTRMELLSGGEKALISLAFLLSLMDTRPSPFSLMDEIDAPLDDANLVSLLEIMKDISAKTQVIFITHNRITMEASSTIYGITMEEEGISKVVSVKL